MTRGSLLAFCLAALFGASGCRGKHRHGHREKLLPPLSAPAWIVDLEVPGFAPSKLAVPLGAVRRLGADGDVRYTFASAIDTERELRASLAALKARFGKYLKTESVTLAGFELGADQAAALAHTEPSFFARVLLVDPAPGSWSSTEAALFGSRGGERVLFACHGPPCVDDAYLRSALTRRAGAEARVVDAGLPGEGLGVASIQRLAPNWSWLSAPAAQKRIAAGGPAPTRPSASSH